VDWATLKSIIAQLEHNRFISFCKAKAQGVLRHFLHNRHETSVINDAVMPLQLFFCLWIKLCGDLANAMLFAALRAAKPHLTTSPNHL
jgi:hypothetical protein